MAMKSYYVDAPSEKASVFILKELGVTLLNEENSSSNELSWSKEDISKEHKSSHNINLKLISGSLIVDVRDTSNSWIRIELTAEKFASLVIPANLYRKITVDADSKYILSAPVSGSVVYSPRFAEDTDSIESFKYHFYRELVCELCQQFFQAGWVTGTGGSISIKFGSRVYMTPSGVQKERIKPDELFVLDTAGNILSVPQRKPDFVCPKLSDCAPLFLHAYQIRNAGAVLHSHAFSTNLITSLFEGKSEFRVSHQEMIKGIRGYGYYDELVVPIIENTAYEHELADMLGETIRKYPKTYAVLVRRHGMYVWGNSWQEAKRHGECLHYLFEIVIKMSQLGLDYTRGPILAPESAPAPTRKTYKHVIFDIEGTICPISFVKDVLFPYASDNVKSYLETSWSSSQTVDDVKELIHQYENDILSSDYSGPVVNKGADKASLIADLESYVKWNISQDRKVTALKQIQGHIWESGYVEGKLKSHIFDDVPKAFQTLISRGSKISIYSSGSRVAQLLLFKYSNHGDLRKYISVYFDTKVGHKRETSSYHEISQYLGADNHGEILFVTDIFEEATAAAAAGLDVVVSVRQGNADLPEDCKFEKLSDFSSL